MFQSILIHFALVCTFCRNTLISSGINTISSHFKIMKKEKIEKWIIAIGLCEWMGCCPSSLPIACPVIFRHKNRVAMHWAIIHGWEDDGREDDGREDDGREDDGWIQIKTLHVWNWHDDSRSHRGSYQSHRDPEDSFRESSTHQRDVPDLAEAEHRRDGARRVLRQVHALVAQDHVHVHLVHRLGDHHARLVGPDPLVHASLRVPLQEGVQFAVPSGERVHAAHSGHGVRVREGAPVASTFIKRSGACELSRDGDPDGKVCVVWWLWGKRVQLRDPISAMDKWTRNGQLNRILMFGAL